MKRILVTGANGLLGQKLVYKLKQMPDVYCIALARGENRLIDKSGYEYINADITDHPNIRKVIESTRPTHIIHTAAMTNVDACETEREDCKRINLDAVKNLATICQDNTIHLIHVSTDFIFDGEEGPYDETAKPNPVSYYGWTKAEAERVVQQIKSPWTIIRTILVFGMVDHMTRSNIVLWVKSSLEQGKQINVVNDQWRTPTLAEDLADGCILAAVKNATGIYNVSGDELMSIYEIACRVADHYGLNKELITPTDSSSLNQPARRPPKTGLIIDKAKHELGYKPHSFESGLKLLDAQLT